LSTAERIKTAFDRNSKALTLRPSIGQGTAVCRVRVSDGLTCEVEDGPWKFTADLSEKWGGKNAGANPGVLGRAALGTCLAINYVLWSAVRGVEFSTIDVEVQADYDSRANLGLDGIPPGYKQVRYIVRVESDAPEEIVRRLLDEADEHCDFLAVFAQPQDVRREVHIAAPQR
jgi:uncharacterized OsmC-like protein